MIITIDSDFVLCDKESIDDYVELLNGLVWDCNQYDGYKVGYRNTMALDLTVASYMLGLDPERVMSEFIKAGLIAKVMDDEDPMDRVKRALDYKDRFDWDYLIDPDDYMGYAPSTSESEYPIYFKVLTPAE